MTTNFPAFFPGFFPQNAFGQFWNQYQPYGNPFFASAFGQFPFTGFGGQPFFGQYPGQTNGFTNGYTNSQFVPGTFGQSFNQFGQFGPGHGTNVSDAIGNYFGQPTGQPIGQYAGQFTGQPTGGFNSSYTNGQYTNGQYPFGPQTTGQYFNGQPFAQWNQFGWGFNPYAAQFAAPFTGQFTNQFGGGQWNNGYTTPVNSFFPTPFAGGNWNNPYINAFNTGYGTQPFNGYGFNTPFFGGFNGWNGFVNPYAFFAGSTPTNFAGAPGFVPNIPGYAGIPSTAGTTGVYPTVNGVPANVAEANKARNIGLSREVA